jgi:hypothetical protein
MSEDEKGFEAVGQIINGFAELSEMFGDVVLYIVTPFISVMTDAVKNLCEELEKINERRKS